MRTQLLGRLDLDARCLRGDLERSARLPHSEQYSEFLCGRAWKSCMLATPGGELGDGVISHYDASRPARFTVYGAELPYLRELVERTFAMERLVFARLAVMSASVGIPHRDYLELSDQLAHRRAECRLHLPLVTSDDCYFTEDNVVYRMRFGEVWAIDVTRVHSSAVLSDVQRVHLLLDFKQTTAAAEIVRFPVDAAAAIPDDSVCRREPLSDQERADLLALAPILELGNLREAIGIVVKKHFSRDGGDDFVWRTLHELARRSGHAGIGERIRELHHYYTMERRER